MTLPPSPVPSPVGHGWLWFGVLVAPVAWILAEVVGYVTVSVSCLGPRGLPGGSGTAYASGGLTIITVVTGIAAAAGLVVGSRSWHVLRRARGAGRPVPSYATFMAFAGAFVSVLLLLNIILFGIPAFVVNVCTGAR